MAVGRGQSPAPRLGRAGQTATGLSGCPDEERGTCGQGGSRSINKCDSVLDLLVLLVRAEMSAGMWGCWQGCRGVGMLVGMSAFPLPALWWVAPPAPGSRVGAVPSPSGCPLHGPPLPPPRPAPPVISLCCPKEDPPVPPARLLGGRRSCCRWLGSLRGGSPRSTEAEPQLIQVIRCLPDTFSLFPLPECPGSPMGWAHV